MRDARTGRSKRSPLGCATVRFTQPTAPIAKPKKECLTTSRATSNSRGRFIGGFGRDSCYRMHGKQDVRYMRNLQRPYSLRPYRKLLIPRLGTQFSWLERCPVVG